jgi:hypothetical protein
MIESYFPNLIELYRRGAAREGCDAWEIKHNEHPRAGRDRP